jgi:hypothetical protein
MEGSIKEINKMCVVQPNTTGKNRWENMTYTLEALVQIPDLGDEIVSIDIQRAALEYYHIDAIDLKTYKNICNLLINKGVIVCQDTNGWYIEDLKNYLAALNMQKELLKAKSDVDIHLIWRYPLFAVIIGVITLLLAASWNGHQHTGQWINSVIYNEVIDILSYGDWLCFVWILGGIAFCIIVCFLRYFDMRIYYNRKRKQYNRIYSYYATINEDAMEALKKYK